MKTFSTVALSILVLLSLSGCAAYKRLGYDGINRDSWQLPDQVIQSLQIEQGSHIADLGAGGGYFTFRLADATGPGGMVYAVDVDSDMTTYLEQKSQALGYKQVKTILADPHDSLLPEKSIDLVLVTNTYHHMTERTRYFSHLKSHLSPGGRVAIIEFDSNTWFAKIFGHSIPTSKIREEMEAAGYQLEEEFTFLPKQSYTLYSIDDKL